MDSQDWDDRYAASGLVWGAEPNRWVVRELTGLRAAADPAEGPAEAFAEGADEPAEGPARGRALDLAAGEGRNSIWLARQGWQVTGLDFSAVALDRAARLAEGLPAATAARLTWRQADARTFDAPAGGYDLILVAYLQLPAEDRRSALRRAAAALAPGGTLLVVGHDSSNLTEGVGGPQDPRVLFTPEDVLADLAEAGLRTVRAERVRRPVGAEAAHVRAGEDRAAEAVDALVRLERP
ncbi:class I SAM-dependent methyltransferase [Kitasatospora sp. NPDC058170]|uniref:class I SAM-dependent methyltransferase n=1 Tax=Kitasatospora sp. NPDC058170 TaxID=3346364 RepID=UPI0036DACB4C